MELVIQNEQFTVRVDTEAKDFKEGDIICAYNEGFPEIGGSGVEILPSWSLIKVRSKQAANFYALVDKHYKVLEIC